MRCSMRVTASKCFNGYAANEILLRTPTVGAIVQNGETMKLISEMQLNFALGMQLMDDCLKRLIQEGKISQEEGYLKALDKASFMQQFTIQPIRCPDFLSAPQK